jgi:O-antigen/teichoic acid export membrane protein
MSTPITTPDSTSLAGRLRFLLRDALLYGGAAAISKAFALVTFPLLARHFTVEEYGTLDYFLVLASLFTIVFIFGQDSAVSRYFYEYQETDIRSQLISQSLVFQLAGLACLLPILWMNADWIAGTISPASDSSLLLKIVLLQLPFLLLINFSQNLLKWTFARAKFLTMSLGYTVVQAGSLVVAVLVLNVGIAGVLIVSLATSATFAALGLLFIRKWLVLPRNFIYLRKMLPFAIPYGLICVASAISPAMERTLLNSLLGAESLGLYAVGTKLAMLMGLFVSAFQTAWGPFSLSLHKQVDAGQTYNWVFKLFALATCLGALTLTLLGQTLIAILATDRYLEASVVVFPVAMGLAIQATSWITEIGIGISKKSHLSLYAYGAGISFTLAGILFFTTFFGLLGIGLGVLTGQIAKAIVASYLAQNVYPLPWDYLPVTYLLTVTILGGLSSIWIGENIGMFFGNLLIGGTMILVAGVGWLGLFSPADRIRLRSLLMRRLATTPP